MGATPTQRRAFGKYRVIGELGGDDQITRYLGEHVGIGRQVEIHTPASGPPDPEADEQLLREARVFGGAHHRNLQSVVDTGKDEMGRPYVIYEALRGDSLEQVIEANPRGVDPQRAARIVVQLLEALRALHDAGVVLRTLSPADVMIEPVTGSEELAKVRRVSHAALLIEGGAEPITHLGYAPCIAPELRRGAPGIDPRVDYYSVGVILRQLLTGRPRGDDQALSDVARRCLARACAEDPEERFASAEGFLQAVALILPPDDRGSERESIPAPKDPLSADLQYLHLRRTTRHGPRGELDGDSRMHLLPVLLTIEAVYRRFGEDVWAKLCQQVENADALLPGAGNTPVHMEKGVAVPLFAQILAEVDDIAGSGDLGLVAQLGEAVLERGLDRLFPDLPRPLTPDVVVDGFRYIWGRIAHDGDARVRRQGPNAARLWVTGQSTPSLELAGWTAGLLRAAMREAGANEPEVLLNPLGGARGRPGSLRDGVGLTSRED